MFLTWKGINAPNARDASIATELFMDEKGSGQGDAQSSQRASFTAV
jgi:hypothetical protein